MLYLILGFLAAAAGGGVMMVRRSKGPSARPVDPFTISDPWRRYVSSAQTHQRRYREIVNTTKAGPLRDSLSRIQIQLDHGVVECYEIAKKGDELDDSLRRLDQASLERKLERATDDVSADSLRSQIATAERVRSSRNETDQRLRVLSTRMGELVAQAAEVSMGTDTTDVLGSAIDEVVTQLEALRLAVDDINGTGRQSPTT